MIGSTNAKRIKRYWNSQLKKTNRKIKGLTQYKDKLVETNHHSEVIRPVDQELFFYNNAKTEITRRIEAL